MSDKNRFSDFGEEYLDFWDEVLVCCPRCDAQAVIRLLDQPPADDPQAFVFAPRRLVCSRCGCTKDWAEQEVVADDAGTDPFFRLPLWLTTSCCGETLFACNERQLDFLAALVGAGLRERRTDARHGRHNRSLAGRLPKWLLSNKNRSAVLTAIERLRQTLETNE